MELNNVEIKRIGEMQEFGANGFKVVKFVVIDDSNSEYPQTLELQCTQEKAENLIKFNKVGERVDCSVNLRGREWTSPEGKVSVFNTIEAWKVFKTETAPTGNVAPAAPFEPATNLNEEDHDDLPF